MRIAKTEVCLLGFEKNARPLLLHEAQDLKNDTSVSVKC